MSISSRYALICSKCAKKHNLLDAWEKSSLCNASESCDMCGEVTGLRDVAIGTKFDFIVTSQSELA